jgi:uncharacterized membrane protein YcjF (UPF0283 family)
MTDEEEKAKIRWKKIKEDIQQNHHLVNNDLIFKAIIKMLDKQSVLK